MIPQVLVSPVLAGLAVGIGVPILLFYVYGVVPVSLCRSGGCGVSTSGTGVRFDFDDENELMGALGVRNGGGKYEAFMPRTHVDCSARLNPSYSRVCRGYSYSYRGLTIAIEIPITRLPCYRRGINRRRESSRWQSIDRGGLPFIG